MIRKFCEILIFLCICLQANAQFVQVDSITITGNKWTKDFVITRDLTFQKDSRINLTDTFEIINVNERRLESLGILTDAEINFSVIDSSTVHCLITVVENWYIYPNPIFELSDRNFAEWWTNNNHALNRVNYGIRLEHINLTGRRDKMTLTYQNGYTQKYELKYNQPFLTKDAKWGTEAFIYYSDQKEMPYITVNNKLRFEDYKANKVLSRFRTGVALFHQPSIYKYHSFRLEYHNNSVHPFVIDSLNPNYFLNDQRQIRFFYFNYYFHVDKRVYPFYPESGYLFAFSFKKEGFGVFKDYNNTSAFVQLEFYHKINDNMVIGTNSKIKANLDRRVVSYANNWALGYGDDILSGYDLYVIDGTDYAYSKNLIRYKLYSAKFQLGDWMFLRQFKLMDVEVYGRANLDVGYVNDPTYGYLNSFTNRLLIGYGPSVDILLYNVYQFNFTLGFNHRGEVRYAFKYHVSF